METEVVTAQEVVEVETQETDWEAEAVKLKEQVNNLNKALHEKRQSKVPADIDSVIEQKLQEIEQKRMGDDLEELAKAIGGDSADKILETYKNELKPSGFSRAALERDLKKAQLLVDKDKLLAEAEKKARKSIAEKSSMETASVNVTSVSEDTDDIELSESERQFIKQMKGYARKQ